MSESWIGSRTVPPESGTFVPPSNTAGVGMSWSCRSKTVCMKGKGRPLPTSRVRCLPLTLTWRTGSLRTPYNFDFLTVTATAKEREIERGLLTHLRDLLLDLGRGFSFVGSQVPVTVDEQTFYIDLLFYHVRLHRYFVFELKVGAFQPEHAGKLGFYLTAVNCTMRTSIEGPSIVAIFQEKTT
jgi:YhcG PDDEXK nuclease domain